MFPFPSTLDPRALLKLATAYQRMTLAATEVIAHRSLQMALGAMTAAEATTMVMEKMTAFTASAEKAAVAAARGSDPTTHRRGGAQALRVGHARQRAPAAALSLPARRGPAA